MVCHSDMRSTGLSTEPCSSWTARWRQTRCCATKPRRTVSRGRGRGGRWRRHLTRLLGPRQRGWMRTSCTTRCAAPSAPPRWPCLTKTRFTTSSTSWPATAETAPSCSSSSSTRETEKGCLVTETWRTGIPLIIRAGLKTAELRSSETRSLVSHAFDLLAFFFLTNHVEAVVAAQLRGALLFTQTSVTSQKTPAELCS